MADSQRKNKENQEIEEGNVAGEEISFAFAGAGTGVVPLVERVVFDVGTHPGSEFAPLQLTGPPGPALPPPVSPPVLPADCIKTLNFKFLQFLAALASKVDSSDSERCQSHVSV